MQCGGSLTQAPAANKDNASEELTPVALTAMVGQFGIGHAAPLLRLEVDDAVGGRRGVSPQSGKTEQRAAQRRDEQGEADQVGDEARDQQQNAGEQDEAARRIGLERAEVTTRHFDTEAGYVAAAGVLLLI